MSNSYAIAAVTATLHDTLLKVRQALPGDGTDADLADAAISTKPPDKARDPEGKNQLNIFLYHMMWDAQLRNTPPTTSPVALRLFYLITAYGQKDDDTLAHRLLGRAMSILQDRAVLTPADIQAALKGNDLYRQIERVRVTPHAITTEEMSKLWTIFQTNYRISTAYEVSVVLIDSALPRTTPLPVLRRGPMDEGVAVLPSMIPPYPILTGIELPNGQPGARLANGATAGDIITLRGYNLTGATVNIRLTSRWSPAPVVVSPLASSTPTALKFQLPDNQTDLPAGSCTVSVGVTNPGDSERVSSALAFPIVPRIKTLPASVGANATLAISVSPQVWIDQQVSVLLDDREYRAKARSGKTDALEFPLKAAPTGQHYVRVRVDGVDSFIINFTTTPLSFDPAVRTSVTP